jgi:hypothetical protein
MRERRLAGSAVRGKRTRRGRKRDAPTFYTRQARGSGLGRLYRTTMAQGGLPKPYVLSRWHGGLTRPPGYPLSRLLRHLDF